MWYAFTGLTETQYGWTEDDMRYEFTGLTETQYGRTDDANVANAAAGYLERKHGKSVYYREISDADAVELKLEKLEEHTGLVCDDDSIPPDFDPAIERFPNLVAAIAKEENGIQKARQIIEMFDDMLYPGDERHEGFDEMLRQVWALSPCTHPDWMDAYAEDATTPPHSPVYATDRWVLGVDYEGDDQYRWELLAWSEVPELTGEAPKGL